MARKPLPNSEQVNTTTSADTEYEYLKRLQFDPQLLKSPMVVLFTNARLVLLLVLALITFGLFAFFNLPRELNPEVEIPIVTVVTVLPGASPRDVEALVTEKLEKAAPNIPNIDLVNSRSTQSLSFIYFQFTSDQDPDDALRIAKDQIDILKSELPEEAEDPRVEKINISDQAFWSVALVAPTDRVSLSTVAQQITDEMEKVNGIRKVDIVGLENQEIAVVLDNQALADHGLSAQSVSQALQSQNLKFPAGDIAVGSVTYSISLDSELNTVDKVRSLILSGNNGTSIPLNQVANVYLRSRESSQSFTSLSESGEPETALQLNIYKADGETINSAFTKADTVLKKELEKYPQVETVTLINYADEISKTFDDLTSNFENSILLIFLVLGLFLGFRQAMIAALSIPLTIICAFIAMYVMGLSLNFLSLFSLLLALSLIGDDAIVMAQATTAYGKKFPPLQTGLLVFKDFFIPIWVGTITVVWSFMPLLLAGGIIGEFIKPIPLVVTATLLSSTAIATLINLPLVILLRKAALPGRVKFLLLVLLFVVSLFAVWSLVKSSPLAPAVMLVYVVLIVTLFASRSKWNVWRSTVTNHRLLTKRVMPFYNKIHQRVLESGSLLSLSPLVRRYRTVVSSLIINRKRRFTVYAIVVGLLVLSGVFIATGWLKTEFFPTTDQTQLYINVEGPPGWQIEQTEVVLKTIADEVRTEEGIEHIFLTVGNQFSAEGGGQSGPQYGSITLRLKPKSERAKDSVRLASELRSHYSTFNQARVTVAELSGGPPAGAQFQANIKGSDLATLEKIATDFQQYLKEIPGAVSISSSLTPGTGNIKVTLHPQELSERGLSAAQVGGWLRTAVSGSQASDTIIDAKEYDITLYLDDSVQTLSYLNNFPLSTPLGTYALSEVATLSLENSPTVIEREEGQRVVRVMAGVEGITTQELLTKFQEKAEEHPLPEGYTWDVGGVNEENTKSVQSIIQAMGISFFLILVTMVLLLQSFRKAFLVMAMIPLAMAGVFINFTIFGIPLSFPALIGVLALFGIVVNNAIMLVEKVNLNLEHGFEMKEALVDACASRVEAIFLSSLTAIVGLLPITVADPLWRGLGGAIIAGLSLSGLMTLFLLPSLYVEIFTFRKNSPATKKTSPQRK